METDIVCSLLEALLATHRYGKPITRDELCRFSSFEGHRGGEAKTAFSALRELPFILDRGRRGVMLDHSRFGSLAQFLADSCDWSAFELRVRLKHFEGWEHVDLE